MYSIDLTSNLKTSLQTLFPTPPKTELKCLEIGAFEGKGSILINNYLCKNSNSKLFCIDTFEVEYSKSAGAWVKGTDKAYSIFQDNVENFKQIVGMKGHSDDMIRLFEDDSIDFCYVDGDHNPLQVYKDIKNLFPKMKNNSIVLFDDYLWELNGMKTKEGIDKFLLEYINQYELLFQNYQLAIRIKKN